MFYNPSATKGHKLIDEAVEKVEKKKNKLGKKMKTYKAFLVCFCKISRNSL